MLAIEFVVDEVVCPSYRVWELRQSNGGAELRIDKPPPLHHMDPPPVRIISCRGIPSGAECLGL
jgi:hypothetical protein